MNPKHDDEYEERLQTLRSIAMIAAAAGDFAEVSKRCSHAESFAPILQPTEYRLASRVLNRLLRLANAASTFQETARAIMREEIEELSKNTEQDQAKYLLL